MTDRNFALQVAFANQLKLEKAIRTNQVVQIVISTELEAAKLAALLKTAGAHVGITITTVEKPVVKADKAPAKADKAPDAKPAKQK
jgi:hypothetical protein